MFNPKLKYSILIALALVALAQSSDAVARTIKIPLIRSVTQGSGLLGQPVVSHYAQVNVGTPAKTFNIQYDAGLNDLFLPHYLWNPFKTYLHYSKGFKCKDSQTCIKNDRQIEADYNGCKLTGKPYEDVMTLHAAPGLNNSTTAAFQFRQNFLAISDASDGRFKDLPVDGFFGLGPAVQSTSTINNFLMTLHRSNVIDNLQYSFWYNPVFDSPQGGELTIGGVDTSRYTGQIFWHHSATTTNHWSLNLQQVLFGGQQIGCTGQQCQAIISSTLNELYGPREDVQKIYTFLNTSHQSSGLEFLDCRRIADLPLITFYIDGIPYSLLPSNYIRKMESGVVFKDNHCYVAILPSTSERKEWILGTNFLSAYYSTFDITYKQVGFAALR